MQSDNEKMLQEIVQNTEMGKNTLEQILPMTNDVQFKAELLRQRNAQRGLAGGGGAYHSHHGRFCIIRCVQTAFPTPFG